MKVWCGFPVCCWTLVALLLSTFVVDLHAQSISSVFGRSPSEDSPVIHASVYRSEHQGWYVETGVLDPHAVAILSVSDAIASDGWMYLNLTSNSAFADDVQAYGAGYVEGYVTAKRIHMHFENVLADNFGSNVTTIPEDVIDWFDQQMHWTDSMVAAHKNDAYWQLVGSIAQQYRGVVDGYNQANPAFPLSYSQMHIIASEGDLWDVMDSLDPSSRPNVNKMTNRELHEYANTNSHCSSLVVVTPDLTELFAGHSSWDTFMVLTRVWKTVSLQLHNPLVKAHTMMFSSYPATLSSEDDWMLMPETQILMMETTNNIFNDSLWGLITPRGLLSWQRVLLANYAAVQSGRDWLLFFDRFSSQTYNNQYQIVAYSLFTPGRPLADDTLWIIEQTPGYTRGDDMTSYLSLGHWPSFNIPFYPDVWERLGYNLLVEKTKDYTWTWQLAPRSLIFRRDASAVQSVEAMARIMRYNKFQTDPLSSGNPENAIMSRFDLLPSLDHEYQPAGGIDSKFCSAAMAAKGSAMIQVGPTHDDQTAFSWSKFEQASGRTYIHLGQPDTWDFPWIHVGSDSDAGSSNRVTA
eukprot:ANDGO_07625.mRNA.1 Phospholipase B-like protein B